MKKLLLFCCVAATLVSCSDDSSSSDASTPPAGGLLVKTITSGEGGSYTTNYTYSGGKLTGFSDSEGKYSTVTYSGDRITNLDDYDSDDVKLTEYVYHYNANGQMDMYTYDDLVGDFQSHEKFVYTYNADNTIGVQHFSKGFDGVGEYELLHDGIIYDNKVTENIAAMGPVPASVDWHEFTYDTKNNPMMLITGFDKIAFAGDRSSKNFANNETSKVHKNSNGLVQPQTTTAYEYNSANFPTKATETEAGGDVTVTEFFYQ